MITQSFLLKSFNALVFQRQTSGSEICQRQRYCHRHSFRCPIGKIFQAEFVINHKKPYLLLRLAVETLKRLSAVHILHLGAAGG